MTGRSVLPERTAVVLAAHGDRGAGHTNAALLRHRAALQASGRFALVAAGVLKGDPSLELALAEAAASGASRVVVYPFFMADGYFVKTRLAERVAAAPPGLPWEIFPPLGLDPDLPGIVLRCAERAAGAAGFAPAATTLLLVGHGSKLGPASADATRSVAAALSRTGVFSSIATAFLEEPPSVEEALRSQRGPVVVSGFFSGDGMHAGDDVPAAMAKCAVHATYTGPIGNDSAI
jgi:sirohydrochlorin ferrochelatase